MLDYIEKLKKKPEPQRRKAVLGISFGITLVIALIWGTFLFMRMSGTDFTFVDNSPEKNMPSFGQSVSNFIDQLSNIFSGTTTSQNAIISPQ